MSKKLQFPKTIRLAQENEIPGTEEDRAKTWQAIQQSNIVTGFVLQESEDATFSHYAEVNINSNQIWIVFQELCLKLLGSQPRLIMGYIDDDISHIGKAKTEAIFEILNSYKDQLTNDCWLQLGLIDDENEKINEVLIHPTKYLSIWLNDVETFKSIMAQYNLPDSNKLEFIDEYPHTTSPYMDSKGNVVDSSDMIERVTKNIADLEARNV